MVSLQKNTLKFIGILFISVFMVLSLKGQNKQQKRIIDQIKSDDAFIYVETEHFSLELAIKLANEQLTNRLKNQTQFEAKRLAIQKGLALPSDVQLVMPKSFTLSAAKVEWKKKKKNHVFLYLKKEEAIKQIASSFIIAHDISNEKWYLGQAIHSDQKISSQLAASKLAENFGVLTNTVQTFVQTETEKTYNERYAQEITQQRTVLLSGQKQISLSWAPNTNASYTAIDQQTIKQIDQQLAEEINNHFQKAERLYAQQSMEQAWYSYYLSYLTILLRFNPMQINEKDAQDIVVEKMTEIVDHHISLNVGKAYLLNKETIAIPIRLNHNQGIKANYNLVYKDFTGTTYTVLEGGKGNLYIKKPSSSTKELPIPIEISISLSAVDRNNPRLAMLDQNYKAWIKKKIHVDLTSIQTIDLQIVYSAALNKYQFIPKLEYIDAQQIDWMIGRSYYLGSTLSLHERELSNLYIAMRVNGEKDWTYTAKIDTVKKLLTKMRFNLDFPTEKK